jgi:hypothetical protein
VVGRAQTSSYNAAAWPVSGTAASMVSCLLVHMLHCSRAFDIRWGDGDKGGGAGRTYTAIDTFDGPMTTVASEQ